MREREDLFLVDLSLLIPEASTPNRQTRIDFHYSRNFVNTFFELEIRALKILLRTLFDTLARHVALTG